MLLLENLVFNALKYAPSDGTVEVRLGLRADRGPADALARPAPTGGLFHRTLPFRPAAGAPFAEVTVVNGGRPIPEPLLGQLFTEFTVGEDKGGAARSTGLGLSIVDQWVRSLGGSVWARSDAENGTRFTFSLPVEVEPRR